MSAPSYYPPGWDKDRWQTASDADFATLTADQFEAFHTGLRAHLGEAGAEEFFAEMDRRQAEVTGNAAPGGVSLSSSSQPPNFVRTLQTCFGEDEEWGFVVFRTAESGNAGAVSTVKARVEEELQAQMRGEGDVARARQRFRLMWVEDQALAGASAAEVAKRYREMSKPSGLDHSLCLCVDDASFRSAQLGTSGLAHVLAVSQSTGLQQHGDEADDERWDGTFKVALRSVVCELFPLVGGGTLSPFEIGVGVTRDLVWTGIGRFGREQASAV